jgi:hypothetical protein
LALVQPKSGTFNEGNASGIVRKATPKIANASRPVMTDPVKRLISHVNAIENRNARRFGAQSSGLLNQIPTIAERITPDSDDAVRFVSRRLFKDHASALHGCMVAHKIIGV